MEKSISGGKMKKLLLNFFGLTLICLATHSAFAADDASAPAPAQKDCSSSQGGTCLADCNQIVANNGAKVIPAGTVTVPAGGPDATNQ